jgi:hypothetical protein
MENKNKPAYPVNGAHENIEHGLTKREYFAGLAMQGLLMEPNQGDISTKHVLKIIGISEDTEYDYLIHYPKYLAKLSIIYADELLNQLNQNK